MRATDGTLRFARCGDDCRRWSEQVVAASVVLALMIGAFLLARRMTGAFTAPLPMPQLLATAIVAAAWAVMVRELSSRAPLYLSLAVIALLMFALACSYPGARVIDWLVWPTAMFAVVLCPPIVRLAATRSGARHAVPHPIATNHETDAEQVLQQLTRVRTEEGHEAIRGLLIGEFAPGERQVTLYIAFCPSFEHLPQIDVNVADDSDATVKLTQSLHNGAQLEVRLPQPAEDATTVTIELFATDADTEITTPPLAV